MTATSAEQAAPPTRPQALPAWLPLAAVGVTLVLWASAFVAIRHLAGTFSPGSLSLGRLLVGSVCLGVGRARPRAAAAHRPPVGLDRDDRRAVVRRLQRRPQRRRAPRRRGHRGDAHPGLAGAGRAPRGDVPQRAVHALPRARPGPRLRRRRPDRHGLGRLQRRPQRARRRSVPARGGRLLRQPGPPEAAGRQDPGDPCDLAGLHGRRGRVPAVRGQLVDDTRSASASDVWWVVYLGVFPTAIAFTTFAYALRTCPPAASASPPTWSRRSRS